MLYPIFMVRNRLGYPLTPSLLLVSQMVFGTLIASEEFDYASSPPTVPLNGQNGGIGWTGAWTATSAYTIASGSLDQAAAISVSGNMVTGIPLIGTATRSLNGSASTIQSALIGTNGLWYRFLASLNSSTGLTPQLDFTANIGSSSAGVALEPSPLNKVTLNLNGVVGASSFSFTLGDVYMVIANLLVTNSGTGAATGNVWVLGPGQSPFDPTSSPTVSFMGSLSGYNSPSTAGIQLDPDPETGFGFDELYIGESPQDLNINLVPEPSTVISFLFGGGYFINKRRKKRADR